MEKHLLLFGNDPLLLQTRAFVLHFAGFRVTRVDNPESLQGQVAVSPVDLLVLCHTLTLAQRDAAIALVLRVWPQANILSMSLFTQPALSGGPNPVVSVLDGPEALVNQSLRLTA